MPEKLDRYHSGEQWRGLLFAFGKIGDPAPIGQDLQEVFDSVIQILNTRRGERVMYPEFGSDLHAFLFEPHDAFTQQAAGSAILRALGTWEPRIHVLNVTFAATSQQINEGVLLVNVTAQLVNNPSQLVDFLVPISSNGGFFN